MPNTFIQFLEQYMDLEIKSTEPAEEKIAIPGMMPPASRGQIVQKSRDAINNAGAMGAGLVGRVFNDFPLEFSPADSGQTFHAIDNQQMTQWMERYFAILSQTKIDIDVQEISLTRKNEPNEISTVMKCTLPDRDTNEIKSILTDIILKACAELLDDNGMLKPEIISLLHLEKLLDNSKKNPRQISQIKSQVIYSYCVQIITLNMIPFLQAKMNEMDLSEDTKLNLLENIGSLTKLIQSIFITRKIELNSQGNQIIVHPFSSFFNNTLNSYLDIHFNEQSIHKKTADELVEFTSDQVQKIMMSDFKKAEYVDTHMNSHALTAHKIQFWIDLCDYCRQSGEKYNTLMMSVLGYLNEQLSVDLTLLNSVYLKKYSMCLEAITPEEKESKHSPASIVEQGSIFHLLNADTNLFIIDTVLSSTTIPKELAQKIIRLKSNTDFIQQSPARVMGELYQMAEVAILKNYKTALEQADFLEQAHTNREILNKLLPGNFDELSLLDIETYNNKLTEITHHLIKSIQTKLSKIHESYFLASDTMRPLYLEFKLFVESLDNTLSRLEDSTSPKNWQPLLQTMCTELPNLTIPLLKFAESFSHVSYASVMPDSSSEIPPELAEYKISAERIAFFNRVNSDLKMLRKLVEQVNQISFALTPESFEQLKTLEAFDSSADDMTTLSKKYINHLKIIFNEMFRAIQQDLIEPNHLIPMHENMSRAYEDHALLVGFMKTELARLDHSSHLWSKALDYFCREYPINISKLKNISRAIAAIQKPGETGLTAETPHAEIPEKGKLKDGRVIPKPSQAENKSHSTSSTNFQILSIMTDEEYLRNVLQAKQKSMGDKKNYNPFPDRYERAASNIAALEFEFPYSYKKLEKELELIDDYLSDNNYNAAIPLINRLPAKILQNIFDYCTVSYDTISNAILKAAEARAVVKIHTAGMSDNESKQEINAQDESQMFIMHETVLNIFAANADKLTKPKQKEKLKNTIGTISQYATNTAEYITMLAAEKEALPTGNRSAVLSECLKQAKKMFLILPAVDPSYFTAIKLLGYANSSESKKLQFSSRDFEIENARKIARLIIQTSLMTVNPTTMPAKLVSKQQELLEALNTVCFAKKVDPELAALLNPVLAVMQAISLPKSSRAPK